MQIVKIVIGDKSIYAAVTPCPKENSVLLYREKNDLDCCIPHIKMGVNVLSDFGRELLQVERKE